MSQAKNFIEQLLNATGASNGSGNRGGNASLPTPPGAGRIATIIGVAFLGWAALSSFYTVQPEERAVVKRFGRVIGITDPGLHFKLPLGLDRVQLVATERVLKQEFGFRTEDSSALERTRFVDQDFPSESLMLTGDLNMIQVEWVVQYRIGDPIRYRDPGSDGQVR
jgi:membrane protease subunit HflK